MKRMATAAVLISALIGTSIATGTGVANAAAPKINTHVVKMVNFSPAVQKQLSRLESTATGRAELQKALTKGLGHAATVSVVRDAHKTHRTGITPDWSCYWQTSCGVDSSGGWHFWVIGSYAALESGALAGLAAECSGALAPFIGFAAPIVCGGVAWVLSNLISGWPRFSNHGVWAAVYLRGIQSGRY
jgi:hypothetical protein